MTGGGDSEVESPGRQSARERSSTAEGRENTVLVLVTVTATKKRIKEVKTLVANRT